MIRHLCVVLLLLAGPVEAGALGGLSGASYRCGAEPVRAGFAEGGALLALRGERHVLEQVRAASGAKYEAPGMVFRVRGKEAMLSLGGEDLGPCVEDGAVEALYRGGGNEPGWVVTLEGARLRLVADYGAVEVEAPVPAPRIEGGAVVYEGAGLAVRVMPGLCRDDATGMPHPDAVEVAWDDRVLAGCGGAPLALLEGPDWRVEEIAGVPGPEAVLRFEGDRVSGSGGCNRFSGTFEITGEGIGFGPAAATRRACPEPLMAQEQALFGALAEVWRFDFDAEGRLLLIGGGEEVLVRASRG